MVTRAGWPPLLAKCASAWTVAWTALLAPTIRRIRPHDPPRSILVIHLDNLGDAILYSPFVESLRTRWPEAGITLVTNSWLTAFWNTCPWIDEVIGFDFPKSRILRSLLLPWIARRFVRRQGLEDRCFDLIVVPRWEMDMRGAKMIASMCGRDRAVGYSESVNVLTQKLNWSFDRLLGHPVSSHGGVTHEAERSRDLLAYLDCPPPNPPRTWVSADGRIRALRSLDQKCGAASLTIGLGVGAGHPKRIWPVERFIDVLRELGPADDGPLRLVVFGGKGDASAAKSISNAFPGSVFDATSQLGFNEIAGLMHACDLFIGNDSGPMHLAAAAGVPVIEISCHPMGGSPEHENSPHRFGPYNVPSVIIRPERPVPPCADACEASGLHCLAAVSSDRVAKAARQRLPESVRSGRRLR